MTAQFEALPVGRGDAFFLQDGEYSFLFDGGESRHWVENHLLSNNVSKLNVVICSHNDKDHAEGIIGILESNKIHIDEVWIPVTWGDFVNLAARKDFWPVALFDELFDNASSKDYENIRNFDKKSIDSIENNLEDSIKMLINMHERNKSLSLELNPFTSSTKKADIEKFINYLFAGFRILQIIKYAYKNKCKIRMFKYLPNGNQNATPVTNYLWIPVNCQEIKQMQSFTNSLSEIINLTIMNFESLVFKYENTDNFSIIFTADSDFSFLNGKKLVFGNPTIATSPHHGSSDNCDVYTKLQSTNITWVRSDCKSRSRPCNEFKQQKSRYCTRCNPRNSIEQSVSINWLNGNWIPAAGVRSCKCK